MAIPYKDCATDASSNFSSDKTKSGVNTWCIHEHFCEIWRKICKQMACKVARRSLCGIALYKRYPCGHKKQHVLCTHAVGSGASDENRTRNLSLGSWCFATKLRSHLPFGSSDRRQCLYFRGAEKWSWKRDLNTRPVHYECTALPTELFQHRLYREISHAGLPIYYTTNSWFVKRFQKNSLKNQKNDWNRRKDVL